MLTGRRFRLDHDAPAIGTFDRVRRVLTIPAGETIYVIAVPIIPGGMVDIRWKDQTLMMFEVDVTGIEIAGESRR